MVSFKEFLVFLYGTHQRPKLPIEFFFFFLIKHPFRTLYLLLILSLSKLLFQIISQVPATAYNPLSDSCTKINRPVLSYSLSHSLSYGRLVGRMVDTPTSSAYEGSAY
jgi:hypothetical protein